jgi:hypothetical protein
LARRLSRKAWRFPTQAQDPPTSTRCRTQIPLLNMQMAWIHIMLIWILSPPQYQGFILKEGMRSFTFDERATSPVSAVGTYSMAGEKKKNLSFLKPKKLCPHAVLGGSYFFSNQPSPVLSSCDQTSYFCGCMMNRPESAADRCL